MAKAKLLFLTLVHPDFLPPVYASAQSLRDLGYEIDIVTFDSFVPSEVDLGKDITVTTMGRHHNVSLWQRLKLRKKFRQYAASLVAQGGYKAIISFCPFSYLTALAVKDGLPAIYFAMEIADFGLAELRRSPLSAISNYRALRSLNKALLVATPSVQRSAWLAGRSHLDFVPATIFNTAYLNEAGAIKDARGKLKQILPETIFDKKIVLYTGAVNDRLCVRELVEAYIGLKDEKSVLVVTGNKDNDYCGKIKQLADESGNKNIYLLPYVTREEMLALQAVADIGVCLMKEVPHFINSQMLAPNKTGEYLGNYAYILGVKNYYMNMFAEAGVASLAETPAPADIIVALKDALEQTADERIKERIRKYVTGNFCMQQQVKPIARALSKL